MKLLPPLHAAALGLLIVSGGCSADAEPAGHTVETLPNGVVRVANTGDGAWTEGTAWRAVEVLRIGREDGEGPDLFGNVAGLEADDAGNLYVLDQQALEVRVFDAGGRHLRTMGRSGRGPGELQQPAGLSIAPDGSLWVADPGNTRYTVFDQAGSLVTSHRRHSSLNTFPWPGLVDRTGRVWDMDAGQMFSGGSPTLVWSDPSSGEKGELDLPTYDAPRFRHEREGSQVMANVPYAPSLRWILTPDGRLWSGVSEQYRLHLHEPGGDTLRIVELASEPVPVTQAERDTALSRLSWFTQQGGRVDAGRVPARKPAFESIRVDDRGYLWVIPSLPEDAAEAAFDVFDPDGVYLGRLAVPVPPNSVHRAIVRGDRLYVGTQAEAGYPQVAVFRLEGRDAP